MQNLMRIFAAIAGIGAAGADAAYAGLRQRIRYALITLMCAILAPTILFLIGMAVGALGAIGAAKVIFALGAFLGIVFATLFYLKGMIYGFAAKAFADATDGVPKLGDIIPSISRKDLDDLLVWARSWTAWYAAACLLFAVTPVWRSLYLAIIIATCIFGFSAIMSGWRTTSKLPRWVATWGMVSIFVGAVGAVFFPDLVDAASAYGDEHVAAVAADVERQTALKQAARAGESKRTERDAGLIKRYRGQQKSLEDRAADGCDGYSDEDRSAGSPFCSAADKRAHATFAEKVRRLEAGTYWRSEQAKRPAKATSGEVLSEPVADEPVPQGEASAVAKLPPPPTLPGGVPSPGRDSTTARQPDSGGGGGIGPVPNIGGIDWNGILAPLPPRRH